MLVEQSADLARWTPVGAQTLFRANSAAPLAPVRLDSTPVRGRYLRLRWETDTPLLAPVSIRAAVLETSDRTAEPRRSAALSPDAVGRGRSFAFAVLTPTPVTAVRIDPAEAGLVVPVRILGRARADDPWRALGAGTAARLPGGLAEDGFIPLAAGPTAQLKVEAVAPSEGFPTPPRVTVALAPQALLFVASGNAPYRLTVGEAKVEPAWLSQAALAPLLGAAALESLPAAVVANGPTVLAATPLEESVPRRTIWLWAALGAGVLVLAGMAWRLARG
jgi:hypothetical protein